MSDEDTIQFPPVPPDAVGTAPVPPDGGEPPLPAGPDEVTPPRPGRRRLLIAALCALAVLVLAVPLALFLVLGGAEPAGDGGAGGGAGTPVTPQPSASTPQTPGPSGTTAPAAPDGRIPLAQLRDATLTIPPWPADNLTGPSGRLTFRDGEVLVPPDDRFDFPRHIVILGVAYGDVDRDGATETLAEIGCVVQGGSSQLIAFDRTATGEIVTLGPVVTTTGAVRVVDLNSVRVRGDGRVDVRVGDFQRCCGDETPQRWQTRGYRWDGHRFHQVSGPTAFPVNPHVTDTSTRAGDLVFGPAVDGVRRGTLSVTVGYVRGAKPHHLALTFYPSPGVERDGTAWPPVHTGPAGFTVDLPTPAAGTTATYTFAFRRAENAGVGDFGIQVIARNASDGGLSEANPFDSQPTVTVRFQD